eukprot:569318-Amphidinium_carterae.2
MALAANVTSGSPILVELLKSDGSGSYYDVLNSAIETQQCWSHLICQCSHINGAKGFCLQAQMSHVV